MNQSRAWLSPEEADKIAYPLAIEALLGVLAQGAVLNEEAAHDWIVATLRDQDPNNQIQARAMNFVSRVVSGPLPIQGAAHPLF